MAAVVLKYFSVASAQRAVTLLGNVVNLGSFGAGRKNLVEDGEGLGYGVRAVLAPSPGLYSKLVPPLGPPQGSAGYRGTHHQPSW